jgi:hypothetical protein
LGFSLNIDPDSYFFRAIVADNAILNLVAVATTKFISLVAEEYPYLAIVFDCTVLYKVIRVTVSDADAISFVFR